MPDINTRGFIVFRAGDRKIIEDFGAIRHVPVAGHGQSGAALRLPCAFVLANQGCADE